MRSLRTILPVLSLFPLVGACILIVREDGHSHHASSEHLEAREHAGLAVEAHEDEPGPAPEHSELEDLPTRLSILRTAREVHDLAGNETCEGVVQQALHVGEMQLEGAPQEAIDATFEGLTAVRLIECLEAAAIEWDTSGCETCARRCRSLAEHYREQGSFER